MCLNDERLIRYPMNKRTIDRPATVGESIVRATKSGHAKVYSPKPHTTTRVRDANCSGMSVTPRLVKSNSE